MPWVSCCFPCSGYAPVIYYIFIFFEDTCLICIRIFQEKPLFIIPIGQPVANAEEVTISTTNGLELHGCYLKAIGPRKGVVLFGLEYGSNCWACVRLLRAFLRDNGFDVFAFETRGQGTSRAQEDYDPIQWVTSYEVEDFRAARP